MYIKQFSLPQSLLLKELLLSILDRDFQLLIIPYYNSNNGLLTIRVTIANPKLSITELDQKLDKMVTPYIAAIALLCTIPGVDRTSAITIISEIGTDMSHKTSDI